MKSTLILKLFLLAAVSCCAQADPNEDQILSKIEVDQATPEYYFFQRVLFVPAGIIRLDGCMAFTGDSLFTGNTRDSSPDGKSIVSTAYREGKPTGETMIETRDAVSGTFYISYYSSFSLSDSVSVSFTSYYPNGHIQERGCTLLPDCPKLFENFFTSDADCSCVRFYPNGQVELRFTRLGFNFHGNYDAFYPSGKLKEHRSYSLGRPIGKWSRYSETGKRTEHLVFKNGKVRGTWSGEY